MPRKPKINIDLSDLSDDAFYTAVMLIYNLLTLNTLLFPGIPIIMGALGPLPPNTLGAAIKVFNDIRLLPIYNGKTADVAATRLAVQQIITQNGSWLNIFCDGVLTLLTKTGYQLEKEAEAQGKLDATEITLVPVIGGMDFMISHVKGTGIRYGVMFTLESNPETDPSKWDHFHYAAHRDGNIPNLLSDVKYKFASFAMGTSTDLTYSHTQTARPL